MERLDRLSRIKRLHASHEETIKHPFHKDEEVSFPENNRTLKDILQDPKQQNRFLNEFLYTHRPDFAVDVADAVREGRLTPEQSNELESMRKLYNLRSREIEIVSQALTADEMKRIAKTDTRLATLVGQTGEGEMARLMRAKMQDFGHSDPTALTMITHALKSIHEIETGKEAEKLDDRLTAILSKYSVSHEELSEATRLGLDAGRSQTLKNLREAASKEYGWFRKSVDFVTFHALSSHRGRKIFRNLEEQEGLMKKCDVHRVTIARFLHATITPDDIHGIQSYMRSGSSLVESVERKNPDTVKTIDEYEHIKKESDPSPAAVVARYEAYEKEECKRRNIKNISKQPALRDSLKEEFAKREVAQRRKYKGRGVFSILLMLLFGSTPATKDDIKSLLP